MATTLQDIRIWDKVSVGDGCWEWTGSRNRSGYGLIWHSSEKRVVPAHRAVYEAFVGPMPPGTEIDHRTCSNPPCVRFDHLAAVLHIENLRRAPNWGGNRTHCPRGHEYTPSNTKAKTQDGYRKRLCRTCDLARQKEWRETHPGYWKKKETTCP